MSVWDKEYKKLLEGLPKNQWVPYCIQNHEIAAVHTSHPHGLLSLGWDGQHKIILYSFPEHDWENQVPLIKKKFEDFKRLMLEAAGSLAKSLNESYPKGLPYLEVPEEDGKYDV